MYWMEMYDNSMNYSDIMRLEPELTDDGRSWDDESFSDDARDFIALVNDKYIQSKMFE